jgi:hypothetical protein
MMDAAHVRALTMMSTRLLSTSRRTMSGAQWRRRLQTDGLRMLSAPSNMGRSVGKVELPKTLGSLAND